jgi:DNA-binding MarR family transcriptional regulator
MSVGQNRAEQDQELSKVQAAQTLASLVAMLMELQRLEPDLTLDGLKALLLVALAVQDEDQLRLPSIGRISSELAKSTSGTSRLVTSLTSPDGPALIQRRLGVSGSRSEALLLTDRGRELVARLLHVTTSKPFETFETQTYERLLEARQRSERRNIKLRMVSVSEDSLGMVIVPPENFMSDEVQSWCEEFLSQPPQAENALEGLRIKFSSIPDAVHFRIRWT